MSDKPHQNLAIIGHVDHGKSTLVGRLLFETGSVPEHVIEQHREEAEEKGKGGFEFAYVMDNLAEERERGVTIDIAHQEFDTDNYYFTIVDCPGHRDFVKNMITGASQADNAVLVVAADDGVAPQTREHVFLARTLGINELIIGVNKMDLVDYKESSYDQVVEEVNDLLNQVRFATDDTTFVPIRRSRATTSPRSPRTHLGTTAPPCWSRSTTCRSPSRRRTRRSDSPSRTFTPSPASGLSP